MPLTTYVKIDYYGLSAYLRGSGELRAALFAHAQVGAEYARSIAPVGPERDPHRGDFKKSIKAETYTAPGGFIQARIVASPIWVEFGRRHREPYSGAHTLKKTGDWLNAPRRRA